MTRRTILVCGLPRSGTSLTMRMLGNAGIETTGNKLSFEDERTVPGPKFDRQWFNSQPGKAIKLLDPEWHDPAIFDRERFVAIFLTRDPEQQAKSGLKFASWQGYKVDVSRQARRAAAAGVARDTLHARRVLLNSRMPVIELAFEWLIREPERATHAMATFLEPHVGPLNPYMMSVLVLKRSPKCLGYMLEDTQIAGVL